MAKDFSIFKDYYLIKCFENQNYCESFHDGTNLHINNMSYFHDLENSFQQDVEGLIFQQQSNVKGYLVGTNVNIDEALNKINVKTDQNNVIKFCNTSIETFLELLCNDGSILATTEDTKFFVNGHIVCFYIIHKKLLSFDEKNISFSNEQELNNFMFFLKDYSDSRKNDKLAYVTVFDAEILLKTFYAKMENRGYSIACGKIEYKDLSDDERINAYNYKDIERIVFTKNTNYEYQREFRICITKQGQQSNKSIQEKDIVLSSAKIKDFIYLSSDYLNNLKKEKTNEI